MSRGFFFKIRIHAGDGVSRRDPSPTERLAPDKGRGHLA